VKLAISFLLGLAMSSYVGAQAGSYQTEADENQLIASENAWNLAQL